jgi:hypothetical protein
MAAHCVGSMTVAAMRTKMFGKSPTVWHQNNFVLSFGRATTQTYSTISNLKK